MSRRQRSAGSIFWGLTLVAIGGLLLARNLGYRVPVWNAVAKYWPVLIITWGVLKLVDYYRYKKSGEHRPLFSGGEVALLILVIFIGTAITAAANISPSFAEIFNIPADFDLWDITGSNYEYAEHRDMEATAGSTIEISNLYGFVDVQPAETNRIVLDVQKFVRASDKEDADRIERDFTFSIRNEGGRYRIVSNRDENVPRSTRNEVRIGNERQRYKSNLTIRVPRRSAIDLNNKYGRVTVEGLEGAQSIVNKYGPATARSITGSVQLENGYGTVLVENASGDVTAMNSYASTTVRNIGGRATVSNKYGAIDIQDVKGGAIVENRYSAINAERVAGDVRITGRNNSVDVDNTMGNLTVETSYKNIGIRDVQGRIAVNNRHGSIDIELEASPKGDININAEYSDVALNLPSDSVFTMRGHTRFGNVDSQFDAISISRSGRDQSLSGSQGQGGSQIVIETRHGDIRLNRRG